MNTFNAEQFSQSLKKMTDEEIKYRMATAEANLYEIQKGIRVEAMPMTMTMITCCANELNARTAGRITAPAVKRNVADRLATKGMVVQWSSSSPDKVKGRAVVFGKTGVSFIDGRDVGEQVATEPGIEVLEYGSSYDVKNHKAEGWAWFEVAVN